MIYPGAFCPLCGRDLLHGGPVVTFPMLGIDDPATAALDDGVVHAECLRAWSLRDRFVAGYNAAAARCAWGDRLVVSGSGDVVRCQVPTAEPGAAPDRGKVRRS